MKKQNYILTMFAFLFIILMAIGLTLGLYAGETQVVNGIDIFTSYNITGNISYVNITLANASAFIQMPTDAPLQNFTIIFDGYSDNTPDSIIYYSGSSGGSGYRTIEKEKIVYKNLTESEKYFYYNKSCEDKEEQEPENINKKVLIVVIIVIALLIAVTVYSLIKSKQEVKNE